MKFKLLTTGLIIALLVGCSGTKQDTIVTSTLEFQQASKSRVTEPNEFDRVSFPLESCGEKLPNDPKAYPVKYYPVFIDYSEGNLQSVKSKYCRDAFKKKRKTTGKDAIQAASFLSIERANKFSKFMSEKLGSGEIDEPTVREAKQTTEGADSPAQSKLSVAKAAKLTPEQVNQLVSAGKNVHLENGKVKELQIVVPTYIPPGFKLDKFEVIGGVYPYYEINYRNTNNGCFSFGAFTAPGAGSPGEYATVNATTPALGMVTIVYTDFDYYYNKPLVAFSYQSNIRDKEVGKYSFYSGSYPNSNCNAVSLKEAIKIVESLQFLNP
ncbi:MAG TPA: hypothetical protein VK203_14410 [Nostocaceae cyanobacterium]|nr:hypothetical protein [Kamptonema sp.]HLO86185.1 hypothetical protein [Nostocaceae cyanobacterium]